MICDKPLTSTLAEAKKLAKLAGESDALFVLTHNYTGYPMVRQARAMVARPASSATIRVVQVEYAQDWLAGRSRRPAQKQAAWRTDPERSGAGGSTGDIGTHAYNLASFVTGLTLEALAADVQTFVPAGSSTTTRTCCCASRAARRACSGAARWRPATRTGCGCASTAQGRARVGAGGPELSVVAARRAERRITRGGAGAGPEAARVTRIPGGHPEGYLEGFANIYSEAARRSARGGRGEPVPPEVVYPTVDDGVKGVAFVEACVRSSRRNGAWVKV